MIQDSTIHWLGSFDLDSLQRISRPITTNQATAGSPSPLSLSHSSDLSTATCPPLSAPIIRAVCVHSTSITFPLCTATAITLHDRRAMLSPSLGDAVWAATCGRGTSSSSAGIHEARRGWPCSDDGSVQRALSFTRPVALTQSSCRVDDGRPPSPHCGEGPSASVVSALPSY